MEDLRKAIRTGVFTGITFDTTQEDLAQGALSYKDVAWTLLVLEKLLLHLGYEFDVIEFYSAVSRPLAEAMSHFNRIAGAQFSAARRAKTGL